MPDLLDPGKPLHRGIPTANQNLRRRSDRHRPLLLEVEIKGAQMALLTMVVLEKMVADPQMACLKMVGPVKMVAVHRKVPWVE
jgi:hypothetical protein